MNRGWLVLGIGGAVMAWRWRRTHARFELRDRVVVITGASSGIGRAAAHAFAAEGAQVVLAARRGELLQEVARELDAYGKKALCIPTDVTQDADRRRLIEVVRREFGRIDVLVNSAGIVRGGQFEYHDPGHLRQMVEVNLYAALRLSQLVLPVMCEQASGHIVNVSSAGGAVRPPGLAGYVATKAGLNGFSEALRREVAGRGVRVSWIMPGFVRTPMLADMNEAYLRTRGFRFDPPQKVAAAMIEAVRSNRGAVFTSGPLEWLAYLAQRYTPGLFEAALRILLPLEAFHELLEQTLP